MGTDEIIQLLWKTGHFNNPSFPTGVKEADLPTLRLTDKSVKTAINSYQEFFAAELDKFSLEEHGRIAIPDGDVGPATAKLFDMERCEYPDFTTAEATGSGSWPANCHSEYPGQHAFAVYFTQSSLPSHWKAIFNETWTLVKQAYADVGIAFFEVDSASKANTVVTWQRSGTWIGLAIVPNRPSCGERIWAKFDNRYASSYSRQQMIDQIARLKAHEFGHNMGMGHSRGGIMNPSIVGGTFSPTAWRGDPSFPTLKKYFGGEPINTPLPPEEPNPPNTSSLYFRGEFEAMLDGKSLGEFILTPKPKV